MDRPNTTARNYLTPPSDSFWSWTDDGGGVIWVDGQPIATRQEIEAVLGRLAPGGLPPFGAVVMMLAACQLGWRDTSTGQGIMAGYVKSLVDRRKPATGMDVVAPAVGMIGQRIQGVLRGLDAIGTLPGDLRERPDSKALLAEILFESSNLRTTPDAAAQVVSELARGVPGRALVHDTGSLAVLDALMMDIEALTGGLADLSEERVRQRLLTGLDVMVRPAALELPPAERVRQLIAELTTDRELAGLGRLAQRLVAAVNVPRRLSSPDELPLGGVSDLSNRGPLERLLISELAHDDLTLAVRVALNEALYLRREAPPRSPPERRCLLLDAGIRMWGVPRVFAAAAAMAIAATADRRARLEVHRARRDGVIAVDPLTREGLIAHLEVLEPSPHPGSALASWVEMLGLSAGAEDTLSDLVLVTHEDVIADPAFLACLPGLKGTDLYAATVNRSGQFRLQLLTRAGKRPISSARMSLDEVLEPAPRSEAHVALASPGADTQLPLILAMHPLPLLLPAMVKPEHVAAGPGRIGVAVTKDGRLLHWRGEGRGARELTAAVPHGKVHEILLSGTGTAEVLIRRERLASMTLLRADLATGAVSSCELAGSVSVPVMVRRQGDVLLIFTRHRVDAFDPGTGERCASSGLLPAGSRWMGGRYFYNRTGWYTVSYDGQEVALRRVNNVADGTVALFDREGLDGPWGITGAGRVYSTATGSQVTPALPFEGALAVHQISRDGQRLLIFKSPVKQATFLLDLARNEIRPVYGEAGLWLEPGLHQTMRTLGGYNLRRNLKGVALGADGSLLLIAADGRALAVQLGRRGHIEIQSTGTVVATGRPRPMQLKSVLFSRVPAPAGTRVRMAAAEFAEGSRLFLDSRGLLHLKSSDRSLAEVTLVLNDTHVAAWTSSGHMCGPPYFIGEMPAVDPRTVWEDLQRIVRRLR